MVYNNFRLQVLGRFLLLMAVLSLMLYVLIYNNWYITSFCLFLVAAALFYDLLLLIEKTNYELARFFAAIRHADYTQRFEPGVKKGIYADLHHEMNEIMTTFQQIKADKEANHYFLQNLVAHIRIGVLSFDQGGEVTILNQAAKELLQLPHLKNVNALHLFSPELAEAVLTLENEESRLVLITRKEQPLLLTLKASTFVLQGQSVKIISLQNIRSEMEEQELDAWQKLIRVLSHEIMNTITPVISLTSSINDLVQSELRSNPELKQVVDEDVLEDIQTGLQTIEKRSAGLLQFVDKYRKLTRVPKPDCKPLDLRELLKNIQTLFIKEFAERNVLLQLQVPKTPLIIEADAEMLEQVFINLIKNGLEACQECAQPRVDIFAYADATENNRVKVEIKDNGKGIPSEILDQIFVPFYTTKRDGSGIGLSLSRQIMRLHKGSIRVTSTGAGQTVFTLAF